MKLQASALHDSLDDPLNGVEEAAERSEDDLWFLPGPMEDEPDDLPPGPRAEPRETAIVDDWRKAEAYNAARLASVAGRLGGLDERLRRGPEGWRHRLALIEAAERGPLVINPIIFAEVSIRFSTGLPSRCSTSVITPLYPM